MLTSIHVADIGAKAPLWRAPRKSAIPGLERADGGMAMRLSTSAVPALDTNRVILVARWQSESSLDAYLSTTGSQFGDGWSARCEPIRATGEWKGVEADLPTEREPERDEPIIVVTQSKTNVMRTGQLMKFTAEASGTMMQSESLLWGSSYTAVPWAGSVTIWQSAAAMVEAVYKTRTGFGNATAPLEGEMTPPEHGEAHYGEGGHRGAMTADSHKPFFKESVYTRLRPLKITGSLGGKNPLPVSIFG